MFSNFDGQTMIGRILILGAMLLVIGGCAVRLGGPKPVSYRTIALSTGPDVAPAQVAGYIREAGANVVLLAAQADSAWFADVAKRADLSLSGPGTAGPVAFAFLAGKPVGDTTLALALPNGGDVVIHDALYRVDKRRYLDLLALRVADPEQARDVMRAVLRYVATDVMSNAAVVLAVDVPDAETGDRVAELLDPAFIDARTCLSSRGQEPGNGGNGGNGAGAGGGMRLFYGPEARVRCESARMLGGESSTVLANLIVGR